MCPDEQVQDVDGVASVIGLIESSFDMMAMLNYPYPTWFVKPLPTYPVTVGWRSHVHWAARTCVGSVQAYDVLCWRQ
jgi:hypothetical protein